MKKLSLPDCYGHACISTETKNISLRIEPVKSISKNLTRDQALDLVRFYYGISVTRDTSWFVDPIVEADASFSMIGNKREVSIIAMALLAHEISEKKNWQVALAILVASACKKREPAIYPQFVEMVSAAAQDMSIVRRKVGKAKPIKVRAVSKDLGASERDLVSENDFVTMNEVLKKLNIDSQEMDQFLATQITNALLPLRSELANLREEKDMLWWLIGGQSTQLNEPYSNMNDARAAFLIGTDLAAICQTGLGPHASAFLIRKALQEGRSDSMPTVTIDMVPELFSADELPKVINTTTIDQVRDFCFLSNALARANDMSPTAWKKKYADDGSLSETIQFEPLELALQSFREALLLKSLSA